MLKMTAKFGKPICVALYAAFTALCVKGIWLPLALLLLMHLTEFFVVGMKVAKQNGIDPVTAFINCICFGFTWWLPIKKNADEKKN